MNPFNRFYDTEINVYEAEENTYERKGEKNFIGTIACDVQHCGGDMESSEYGFAENKAYKIFTDKNDILIAGRYVLFSGDWYRIVRSDKCRLGLTAVMRGVEDGH